ncbi:uncharacterized protein BXZ73DRAFT_106752 [Epithele typhae]|uniref:uncharacterized protein n=1 Tax=Epithele typhae TaxID=378194 RepID=UPI002007951B|nr:uncharacterized protein BXZ73DRAFT_106752 [Epithele typhae]KAH9913967.1 hypothetical protein BXZ73DRAFT_106752 [Epithele typhae]
MAFPLPSHLPRKKDARDVSTQILTQVSETSAKALSAELASSWVSELNDTIRQTKQRIHERISSDLPAFERQLASSIAVQERLHSLSHNVDSLEESISNPQSGLVPTLVNTLTSHAAVAQNAADARARHHALAHLLQSRNELRRLTRLVEKAELADATVACASLGKMIAEAPPPLLKSEVMGDMKRRCAALQNRTEEQLLDAYSRSISVTASEIVVKSSVQAVPPRAYRHGPSLPTAVNGENMDAVIGLSAILQSMSPSTLSMHLSTLRRDIIAHCIEYVLKQPLQLLHEKTEDMTGMVEYKLSLRRGPPNTHDLTLHLDNLVTTMTFLNDHLFPHLPPPERKAFPLSLCTSLRTAILNHLLLPNLASSLATLPAFLDLTKRAVEMEDTVIMRMFGESGADRGIKSWADAVGHHYERKRRADILDKARVVVVAQYDDSSAFRVDAPLVAQEKIIPIQVVDEPVVVNGKAAAANGHAEEVGAVADDAWGFEEEPAKKTDESPTDDWGFDDDLDAETEALNPNPPAAPASPPQPQPAPLPAAPAEESAEDPGDAWGWNDDAEEIPDESIAVEDDSPWDDTWDEKPVTPVKAPKQAKGLEKRFGNKSLPTSPVASTLPTMSVRAETAPAPSSSHPPLPSQPVQPPHHAPPPMLKPLQVTESYAVSGRTKALLRLVEDVLREGAELAASGTLSTSSAPGDIVLQAAPMALELFRALVPVTNAVQLKQAAKEPMRFSNDCMFVGQEVRRVVTTLAGTQVAARGKLEEGVERLRVLSESWYEDAVSREEKVIEETLEEARGFIDTHLQDRYDECESAVNEVLQRIRRIAPQWKAVLMKSRYYEALGTLVECALSRILGDILSLEDITETESHKLCELCHIMNSLEGLFVEDPEQPSFVVSYVPSWLKFSYLSDLLEASIADISYLFEEGALVDFEIEELVKLVKALFADTPLRANTIQRLQQGHPVRGT